MDTNAASPASDSTIGSSARIRSHFRSHKLLGLLLAMSVTGFGGEIREIPHGSATAGDRTDAPDPPTRPDHRVPPAPSSPGAGRETLESTPDVVADYTGGTAARFHTADGTPIEGDVFLLMGSTGSTARARLYDRTPYTHDAGDHPDTVASNLLAFQTVLGITGADIELLDLTAAPGGGPSGGITRAIAYLNLASDGAFTGDLRVAATGRLGVEGHVSSIDHIDLKTAAAHLAGADVLFTPTAPSTEIGLAYGARLVGELARDTSDSLTLHDPERLATFRQWGVNRPVGMDIVDARHLIDVSSYLCGAGSDYACDVTDLLDRQAKQRFDQLQDEARTESDRLHAVSRQNRAAEPVPPPTSRCADAPPSVPTQAQHASAVCFR